MTSSSSAMVGAITGTLRSGSVSIGETKIVLPQTCVVYCEAPITVARMPSFEGSSVGPQPSTRARISCASSDAEIAEGLRLAAVDVFGHAAGERDLGRWCGRA